MSLINPVILAVITLLFLSLLRVNVVIGLIIAALVAGFTSHLTMTETIQTFVSGLGGGAEVAMNYAILGAFAVAISRSGVTDLLAYKIIHAMGKTPDSKKMTLFKGGILTILLLFAVSSQNILPVHIAFIPILVPPLLTLFNRLNLDRRAVACVLTFGLTSTYMWLPVGFGKIFIESVLVKNINLAGEPFGLQTNVSEVSMAMLIPVFGMFLGLLTAIFISYRKPRHYLSEKNIGEEDILNHIENIRPFQLIVAGIAVIVTFVLQLLTSSTIIGGLAGLLIFGLCGIFKLKESNDIFHQGLNLMAMIGFVMIAASGFANVINATGGVNILVNTIAQGLGENKALAAFLMLLVGLFITMGIGSSFSTVPIITSIYVPLCISLGFSSLATIVIVGVSAALGDAGSPASDSTLGPTSGLNADSLHDHIWDSVVPTFLHYNIPLILFGWLAAMFL